MKLANLCALLFGIFSPSVTAQDDAQIEDSKLITITIFDCNPQVDFHAYNLVCSPGNGTSCEYWQSSVPLDPPSGGKGIGSTIIPNAIPDGCEPGEEGLGPAGILHVPIGSEIWFGIVSFPEVEKDHDENPDTLDVDSKAIVCPKLYTISRCYNEYKLRQSPDSDAPS